ncbi:MAG: C4-type zinc ribbon domain-containing protein [Terriglobia bacterium]
MHPEVEKLLRLQKIESQIKYHTDRIEQLPARFSALEAKLNATVSAVNSAKDQLSKLALEKKKLEASIQDIEQKNSKYRGQLTEVKTNEQYRALLHEIEFNEQQIKKIEDEILAFMEQEEQRRQESKTGEERLKAEKSQVEGEKKVVEAEVQQDKVTLAALEDQRQIILQSIEKSVLGSYMQISSYRKGTALARAYQESCQGCHVRIRPQLLTLIMNGDTIITCDSCSRILYWEPDAPYESSS